jgi:hypothetical protein
MGKKLTGECLCATVKFSVKLVPVGSLNELPDLQPQANIFTSEEACWFKSGLKAERFGGFPE